MHWRRKWQPTPVFLPGAWWAAVYGVTQSQTRLKQLSCSSSHGMMGASVAFGSSGVNILGDLLSEDYPTYGD